jgi:hypothetical protein
MQISPYSVLNAVETVAEQKTAQSLTERVAKLEWQNHWMKRGAIGAIILLVVVGKLARASD